MTSQPNSNRSNDHYSGTPPQKSSKLLFSPLAWALLLAATFAAFWTLKTPSSTPLAEISKSTDKAAFNELVEGNGILMPSTGRIFSLSTRVDGIIRHINTKWGEKVKRGDILVEIYDHDFDSQFNRAKLNLEKLTLEYERLKKEISTEETAETKVFQTQLATNEFNEEQITRRIEKLKDELDLKNQLLNKGLVSPSAVNEVEDRISGSRIERETVKTSIAQIRFDLLRGYRSEELRSKFNQLISAKDEYALLKTQKHYYQVDNPWDGEVLQISAYEGEIVSRGKELMLIEGESSKVSQNQIFAFFNINIGKRIGVGQPATISVTTIDPAVYGTLSGKVIKVSKYPFTNDAINTYLFNSDLVSELTDGKPCIMAVIEIKQDPKTHEFIWSKGKQPSLTLNFGTICKVTIETSD